MILTRYAASNEDRETMKPLVMLGTFEASVGSKHGPLAVDLISVGGRCDVEVLSRRVRGRRAHMHFILRPLC
jgi:hypothetical protein